MAVYTVTISSAGSPDIVSLTDGSTYAVLEVSAGRGPKGDGFTGGTYNASTGVVTFTSNDGIGFSTGDLRGDLSEPGPIGDVTPNTGAFTSLTATTADINGGTIDGAVIGGTTPAAGNFTTGSFTGNVTFGDNDKAIFGAGSDLQIYHDGSNSIIADVGAGDLELRGTNFKISSSTGSLNFLETSSIGLWAKLKYNNSEKLATTNTGVDVTGTITSDGLTVQNDSGTKQVIIANATPGSDGSPQFTDILFTGFTSRDKARIRGVDENASFVGGRLQLQTSDANSTDQSSLKTRINIDRNGDISFYEDTGTTPKFFWDASAESLGIGTSSPEAPLHIGPAATYSGSTSTDNVVGSFNSDSSETTLRVKSRGYASATKANLDLVNFESKNLSIRAGFRLSGGVGSNAGTSNEYLAFSAVELASGGGITETERMRIDSSGNLLVGTTTTANPTSGGFLVRPGSDTFIQVGGTSTTTQTKVFFYNANGVVGQIDTSGSSTSYNTSSDYRLKENITDAQDASAVIDGIQVRQFDWKADGEHQRYGMIAQELDTVAPEAVTKGETEDDMWAVDYSKLVPMLVKEIQDLRKRVAALET